MMNTMTRLPRHDYHVGLICALHKELAAAMTMLDEKHVKLAEQDPHDNNSYVLGRIHEHNVVIACMEEGVNGLVPAANVARDMARTFATLRICLMVGIGGGIPDLSKGVDIRLGDVVVSAPKDSYGGVVQYDKGKSEGGGKFVITGQLNKPPALLLRTLSQLRAEHEMNSGKGSQYIEEALARYPNLRGKGFIFPDHPDCLHCETCDQDIDQRNPKCSSPHVKRASREDKAAIIHYGTIASGNQVIKDAIVRDRLRDEFNALCVEMEAAGLMNDFPCLIIRGICDYADSHKDNVWQGYAAMAAAAFAKELLGYITPLQAEQEPPLEQISGILENIHLTSKAQLSFTKAQALNDKAQHQNDGRNQCHHNFRVTPYELQKNINPERVPGTCKWVLTHPRYIEWTSKTDNALLWISADPGCGKSVLARSLVDNELQNTSDHTVCYFFFKDNGEQDELSTALCSLLHQLFSHQPQLIQHSMDSWEKNGDRLAKEVFELWRILLASAKSDQAHDVTCVFDAVDECQSRDRSLLIKMLTSFVTETQSATSEERQSRLRFLITSRPYEDIETNFRNAIEELPSIRLRGEDENEEIGQEIDLVVKMQVYKLAKELNLDRQTTNRLEEKLVGMQHRTYLWLHLAIDGIRQTHHTSIRPNEAIIETLPFSVEDAYTKILQRVPKGMEDKTRMILQIVVGARRPLTVKEMAVALGIATSIPGTSFEEAVLDPSWLETNIRHWCGLFIFINHARIYLIHQTAKEFLISNSEKPLAHNYTDWKKCLRTPENEELMARICIQFLCSDRVRRITFEDRNSNGQAIDGFLAYSAMHWPDHFREIPVLERHEYFIAHAWRLYNTEEFRPFNLWYAIYRRIKRIEEHPPGSTICVLAMLGHAEVLKRMLPSWTNEYIDDPDEKGCTALAQASLFGHEKTVQMLLQRGAKVNSGSGISDNALSAASWKGHAKIVEMLIKHGACIDTPIRTRLRRSTIREGSGLCLASAQGHEDVVRLLLREGADVNLVGSHRGTALHNAVRKGHKNVVQILLESGADVSIEGPHGIPSELVRKIHDSTVQDQISQLLKQQAMEQTFSQLPKKNWTD